MTESKQRTIEEFSVVFSKLPKEEQNFILGRVAGYKDGYEAGKKENKKGD